MLFVGVGVYSQHNANEKLIKKGVSRYYSFNIKVGEKIYFLSSARYDSSSKIFSGSLASVDSSSTAKDYVLKEKEMQIVVASLFVNSVFITINLKDIQAVYIAEPY